MNYTGQASVYWGQLPEASANSYMIQPPTLLQLFLCLPL